MTYQSFKPSPLPPNPELNINSDIVKKLVEANRDLVRLDTASDLEVSYNTVSAAVGKLVQAGILKDKNRRKAMRIWRW